jgi:hypothetical protein
LNKEIFKQEARIKILAEEERKDAKNVIAYTKVLNKLYRKDRDMENHIRENYPKIKSYNDLQAFGCFVVFDDVVAASKCYKDYSNTRSIVYQSRLKLMEKYKVKVEYADEPNNINWENLEVSRWESFWRSFATILIAIVSFLLIINRYFYSQLLYLCI